LRRAGVGLLIVTLALTIIAYLPAGSLAASVRTSLAANDQRRDR